MEENSLMTLQEVADELDLHYMTVYRYVRLGYLPAHKDGGSWRVTRDDVAQLRAEPPGAAGRGKPSSPWDERLVQRLLAADQAGSWKVVQAAQVSGMSLAKVYTDMVIPALRKVGEEWAAGRVSIAQEHAATQVAIRVVSLLSAQISRRGVSKGTVVVGTPASELHGLPLMIAADLIRLEGFDVLDLGCNLPPESFAEVVGMQQRLVAVGISVTAPGQAEEIATTIAAVRAVVDVPILVGGSAIDGSQHAKLLGADSGAHDVAEIIPALLEMVG